MIFSFLLNINDTGNFQHAKCIQYLSYLKKQNKNNNQNNNKKMTTILKFKITIKTATSNIFSDFIAILDMGIATILVSLGSSKDEI